MALATGHRFGAVLVGALVLAAPDALGSSHREAPAIAGMPRVDATDFYMFRSYEPGRADFVTLIANYVPLQQPGGGPDYHKLDNDAIYEIHLDNDGDAVEDSTFQFDFDTNLANDGAGIALQIGDRQVPIPSRQAGQLGTRPGDANINEFETYRIAMIRGDRRSGTRTTLTRAGGTVTPFLKPLDNIGAKTIPNYAAYARSHVFPLRIPNCNRQGQVFVGQRAEAFAGNTGALFDLVDLVPIQGVADPAWPQHASRSPLPGGIVQNRANDDLFGKLNTTSIALELPIPCLTGAGNGVIGGWTTASLPQARLLDPTPTYDGTASQGGAFVQVSRLSAPLINALFIGLPDKDLFNASQPVQDAAFETYLTHPTLPALLDLLFRGTINAGLGAGSGTVAPTNLPRDDLVAASLTGLPGINQMATTTRSEMMRLNTAIPPTPRGRQNSFGVMAGDSAGFPNGRRPGDDVVDITLRLAMGALCHPLTLDGRPGVPGGGPGNFGTLGICDPLDAVAGSLPFTDGAPIRATELEGAFPYLNTPISGHASRR